MACKAVPSVIAARPRYRAMTPRRSALVRSLRRASDRGGASSQARAYRSLGASQSLDRFLGWAAAQPEDLALDRELVAAVHRPPGVPDCLSDTFEAPVDQWLVLVLRALRQLQDRSRLSRLRHE